MRAMDLRAEIDRIAGDDVAALQRLDRLAHLMDERFRIPGTNRRMGLDGLIGLIPGIGDLATGAISLYVVLEAWRLGASRLVIARMLANIGVDAAVGSVPLAGDLFDIAWKANRRNVALLRRQLERAPRRPIAH